MADPIPLRGTSLHDGVAARLRALVFDGALAPGQWVDEKALAARGRSAARRCARR
jgi:DNA-binding GntR family transcriptional regulator